MPRVCITVPGKNAQPYRFSLDRKIVRLGRAADNDIIVDCPSVSSHHCEMRRVDGGYTLQDLDSTNGIKVDDDRMEVIDLENDMEITVGDAALEFELTSEELASLGEEDHTDHSKRKLPPADKKADDKVKDEEEKPAKRRSDDEDAEPPRKPKKKDPARKADAPIVQPSGGLSFLISMVFLILAGASFFLGMSLKHQKEYDRSLWNDLINGGQAVEEPAPADPVEPEGGAES